MVRFKQVTFLAFFACFYSQLNSGDALKCFCLGHCPDHPQDPLTNGTCEAKEGAHCFSAVEEVLDPQTGRYVPERTYGCLPPDETGLLQCQGHLVPHVNPSSIGCCSDEDYCNVRLSPMYEPTSDNDYLDDNHDSNNETQWVMDNMTLNVLLGCFIVLLVIAVLVIILFYNYYRKKELTQQKYVRHDPEAALRLYPGNLQDLIEQSSGSGSGVPRIVQQTIAKQINVLGHHPIGQGRFGQVWLAMFRQTDEVAVKVFWTKDEASWQRESEIYHTSLLRHENILGFIASDIRGTGSNTQMLLITAFHQYGSLYNFLWNQENGLDEKTMLKLAYTAACGLVHLHTEIHGTIGKPMIAHRDIKSRNILVKDDLSCCIADFGLAVKYNRNENEIDVGLPNARVGTRRYMAPEVLDNTMNTRDFNSYLQADVYSFSLVLWELCRRTRTGKEKESFEDCQLPYYEYLHNRADPSFEDMEVVIIKEELRPTIPRRWETTDTLSLLSRLMQDCWQKKPAARLSMLRIKKNLHDLRVPPAMMSLQPKMDETCMKFARINNSNSSTIPMRNHLMTS